MMKEAKGPDVCWVGGTDAFAEDERNKCRKGSCEPQISREQDEGFADMGRIMYDTYTHV